MSASKRAPEDACFESVDRFGGKGFKWSGGLSCHSAARGKHNFMAVSDHYSLDQLLGGTLFKTFRETFCCSWVGEGAGGAGDDGG